MREIKKQIYGRKIIGRQKVRWSIDINQKKVFRYIQTELAKLHFTAVSNLSRLFETDFTSSTRGWIAAVQRSPRVHRQRLQMRGNQRRHLLGQL